MPVHIIVMNTRLRIGKSNFRLRSNITSKESTLQLVYDYLWLTPFYKAFLVTIDVPEIYMKEFWATATVHHHSIRFKMDNRRRIVNLEYFRETMHICPRLFGHTFDDLPFEEEILAFLRFLGHSREIKKLTDVNINKLHQPWRSFVAIINKCLSRKSTGYDSLWLSQAQILWGMYHKKNVDFAYLMWEDFVYQVEHKDAKKSNEMYYPMFTKFGVMLPIELTNEDIRNSEAYKEYYAVASGAAPPKTKISVRKTKSSFDTTITPPTAIGTRLSTSAKGKQHAKASKAKSLNVLSEVAMTESEQLKLATKRSLQQTHISQASGSGADEGTCIIPGVPDVPTEEMTMIKMKEMMMTIKMKVMMMIKIPMMKDVEDVEDESYRDVNINLEGRDVQMTDVHTTQEFEDTHVTLTSVNPDGQQQSSSTYVLAPTTVASLTLSTPTLTLLTIPTISTVPQAPTPLTTTLSTLLQDLPNFVKVAVQIQCDRPRDEAQAENEEFLKNLDENIQKFIKEQVKEQVK
nr:hypothetical protein [Tanacetum cinerariifolium]